MSNLDKDTVFDIFKHLYRAQGATIVTTIIWFIKMAKNFRRPRPWECFVGQIFIYGIFITACYPFTRDPKSWDALCSKHGVDRQGAQVRHVMLFSMANFGCGMISTFAWSLVESEVVERRLGFVSRLCLDISMCCMEILLLAGLNHANTLARLISGAKNSGQP